MGRFYEVILVSLLIAYLLNTETTWAKRSGSSSSSKKTSFFSNKGGKQSKPSSSQPGNSPRQPQSPYQNTNPYPPGGSYPHPGRENTNTGGRPKQNPPSFPGTGSNPNHDLGRVNHGGFPNQVPPAGGGYPNQYPGRAGTNQGGYNQYPAAGGYPNQNPGRNNPNQYPTAGAGAGGIPNQRPGNPYQSPAGGHPVQGGNAGQGWGLPAANPGGYGGGGMGGYAGGGMGGYAGGGMGGYAGGGMGGYAGGGGYAGAGGIPNQRPGNPYQSPAGGHPVQGGNTGQGWGLPAANPGGYGGGGMGGYGGGGMGGYGGGGIGGYPNWNPNNKILSPRYGGGSYGGGYGMGGSPFSRSVQSMGYQPKSPGFAKTAMMAAGVGALTGMAVGYGLGRFPRPHFSFHNPEEEYYYNNYMYKQYGSRSTDDKDYGRDYVFNPPPRAESYENFMSRCMNGTDLLKDQGSSSSTPKSDGDEDDDTVSIEEIGYPALIEQMKSRRCVEKYMIYSEKFLVKRKAEQQSQPSHSSHLSSGVIQLFISVFMLLSSIFLLQ